MAGFFPLNLSMPSDLSIWMIRILMVWMYRSSFAGNVIPFYTHLAKSSYMLLLYYMNFYFWSLCQGELRLVVVIKIKYVCTIRVERDLKMSSYPRAVKIPFIRNLNAYSLNVRRQRKSYSTLNYLIKVLKTFRYVTSLVPKHLGYRKRKWKRYFFLLLVRKMKNNRFISQCLRR